MSIQADDGFTEEELNYIDDQPEACTGMSILPNGESMYEWEKRTTGKISPATEGMKMTEERMKLAKSLTVVGGVEAKGEPVTLRRVTTKNVQIYDAPNGKVIDSYPKNLAVKLLGKKDSWVFISGYWSHQCDFGWTQEKNLITKSRKELQSLGVFGR